MARFNVLSGSTAVPVLEPGFGQMWLIPSGASGDWASHVGKIAIGNGNEGYIYRALVDGDEVFLIDEDELYLVVGGGTLQQTYPPSGGGGNLATDPLADAKGDGFFATGDGAIARVPVGANGLALVASSAASAGVGYAAIARYTLPPIAGEWYSNIRDGSSVATQAITADRIELAPHFFEHTTVVDRLAISVQAASGGTSCKIVVYESAANGRPDALMHETGSLDSGSTGIKEATVSLTFEAGKVYWFGVRSNGAPTLHSTNGWSHTTISFGTSAGTGACRILRRSSQTFANAAPDPWTYTATELVAFFPPYFVLWRAA